MQVRQPILASAYGPYSLEYGRKALQPSDLGKRRQHTYKCAVPRLECLFVEARGTSEPAAKKDTKKLL